MPGSLLLSVESKMDHSGLEQVPRWGETTDWISDLLLESECGVCVKSNGEVKMKHYRVDLLEESDGESVARRGSVLEAAFEVMQDRDGWEQISFFLNPNDGLRGNRPVDVLRRKQMAVSKVVAAAREFVEAGEEMTWHDSSAMLPSRGAGDL